jgi:arylsulfatase A-like enzyme
MTLLAAFACTRTEPRPRVLTAETPLHLEAYLDEATVEGSELPSDVAEPMTWRFDEPQPGWRALSFQRFGSAQMEPIEGALRVHLAERNRDDDFLRGGIYVDLRDLRREEWDHVLIRIRTTDVFETLELAFNLGDRPVPDTEEPSPYLYAGERMPIVADGTLQAYRLRADWSAPWWGAWQGPWRQLILVASSAVPASFDLVSVTLVPKAAVYAAAPVGVRTEARGDEHRHTLYAHSPGRIAYRLRVPDGGRLDVGLGVVRADAPVTFEVTARPEGGETEVLFQEAHDEPTRWAQRSVDLSPMAGQTMTLTLATRSDQAGTVALWAAPVISGVRAPDKPNVIFYVMDSADSAQMSVYGYNRRTTPFMERLAEEGVVFDNAYSNSRWTKVSTASFMTSLHNSVLGGYDGDSTPVPNEATTMAQHFHRAGYQTAVFTANPFAGTTSDLGREVDTLWEGEIEDNATSSVVLHERFLNWRESYPGAPYWVHFQTTDVHEPFHRTPPFAGLFVSPEELETREEWNRKLSEAGGHAVWSEAYEKTGLKPHEFFSMQRGLYDEAMAHNDFQLRRLVERLQSQDDWENTLLIVASDHGAWGGSDEMALGLLDPLPPPWGPMFRPSFTQIPLIVVWPGEIAGGRRFTEPVSMIDVLPTLLDLMGLAIPEVMQGQSLAPLLRGEQDFETKPAILDEFYVHAKTGRLNGWIEVVDGRWGASLEILPDGEFKGPRTDMFAGYLGRPHRLLVYDLWDDPYCLEPLNEKRPDLVEKYTRFLEEQFAAHRVLAERFTQPEGVSLTPQQLETLRSLGYIQ